MEIKRFNLDIPSDYEESFTLSQRVLSIDLYKVSKE